MSEALEGRSLSVPVRPPGPLAGVAAWLREHDPDYARAAPGRPDGDRHAGHVRDRRRGDRQPAPGHVRRLRLVRDAAAGRLLGADPRPGPGPAALGVACAGARLSGHAGRARRLAGRGRRWRSSASRCSSRGWSARCWPARPPRCCSPSSCPSRCRARSPRSPTGVAGWGLAAAVSLAGHRAAVARAGAQPVRSAAIDACRALAAAAARRGRAARDGRRLHRGHAGSTRRRGRAEEAVEGCRRAFFATPYRPTGLTTRRACGGPPRRRAALAEHDRPALQPAGAPGAPRPCTSARSAGPPPRCSAQAADCSIAPEPKRRAARRAGGNARRAGGAGDGDDLAAAGAHDRRPRRRRQALARSSPRWTRASARRSSASSSPRSRPTPISPPPPSVAAGWSDCSGASPRGCAARSPRSASAPAPRSSGTRCGCTTACAGRRRSALAVLVADLSGVQHAFWVVFGTLSVLRSNALSTGQNALRALLGTTAGFIIGGAIVLPGRHEHDRPVGTAADRGAAGRPRPGRDLLRRRAGRFHADAADPVQHPRSCGLADRAAAGRGHRHRRRGQPGRRAAVLAPRRRSPPWASALAEAYSGQRTLPGRRRGLRTRPLRRLRSPPPRPARRRRSRRPPPPPARRHLPQLPGRAGLQADPPREVTGLVTGVAGVRLAADAVLDLWDGDGAPKATARRPGGSCSAPPSA